MKKENKLGRLSFTVLQHAQRLSSRLKTLSGGIRREVSRESDITSLSLETALSILDALLKLLELTARVTIMTLSALPGLVVYLTLMADLKITELRLKNLL